MKVAIPEEQRGRQVGRDEGHGTHGSCRGTRQQHGREQIGLGRAGAIAHEGHGARDGRVEPDHRHRPDEHRNLLDERVRRHALGVLAERDQAVGEEAAEPDCDLREHGHGKVAPESAAGLARGPRYASHRFLR